MPMRREGLHEIFQHRTHPPHDLNAACAAMTYFDATEVHKVLPVGRAKKESQFAVGVADFLAAEMPKPHQPKQTVKLIDGKRTAVVGSLIAGDSALMAISTRIRNAKVGSCSMVRSDPRATAARSWWSPIAPAPPYNRNKGSSTATKSPTWGTNSITPLAFRACSTSPVMSTASTIREAPALVTIRSGDPIVWGDRGGGRTVGSG